MSDQKDEQTIIKLSNGRTAQLTEAGWEVWPWRTDRRPYVFSTAKAAQRWGDKTDQWGQRRVKVDEQ